MERTEFEAELQRDGYQVVQNTMQPGAINPEHAHDFDARLLVVAGEMTIVAEGIETAIEHEIMAMAGCTELQGYRFSRPLPAGKIGDIVRRFSREPQLPPRTVEGTAA